LAVTVNRYLADVKKIADASSSPQRGLAKSMSTPRFTAPVGGREEDR